MSRDYLDIDDVLEIHHQQIERYGGSHGIRDRAGLESAVARPQSGYYDGPIEEAAALWESLSQNHPFVDGNKRTAFSSTNRFLGLNGYEITADPMDTNGFIQERFAKKEMAYDHLKPWLQDNTRERVVEQTKAQTDEPEPEPARTQDTLHKVNMESVKSKTQTRLETSQSQGHDKGQDV